MDCDELERMRTQVTKTEPGLTRPAVILLVEDNPADAELAMIGLRSGHHTISVHTVETGEEAMAFLRREGDRAEAPRPDLILLDLNLPGMDGSEVLQEVKSDPALRTIPVVILTTSSAPPEIHSAYSNHANAFMTKPVHLDELNNLMGQLQEYWFGLVHLPPTG